MLQPLEIPLEKGNNNNIGIKGKFIRTPNLTSIKPLTYINELNVSKINQTYLLNEYLRTIMYRSASQSQSSCSCCISASLHAFLTLSRAQVSH